MYTETNYLRNHDMTVQRGKQYNGTGVNTVRTLLKQVQSMTFDYMLAEINNQND